MAGGVEGSAVVDRRDHCLLPGPAEARHPSAVAAAERCHDSRVLDGNQLVSRPAATQQHLACGAEPAWITAYICGTSVKLLGNCQSWQASLSCNASHKCSAYKGWWDHLGFPHQAHDSKELLLCGGRATIRLYRDTVTARRLVVMQHSQACL